MEVEQQLATLQDSYDTLNEAKKEVDLKLSQLQKDKVQLDADVGTLESLQVTTAQQSKQAEELKAQHNRFTTNVASFAAGCLGVNSNNLNFWKKFTDILAAERWVLRIEALKKPVWEIIARTKDDALWNRLQAYRSTTTLVLAVELSLVVDEKEARKRRQYYCSVF